MLSFNFQSGNEVLLGSAKTNRLVLKAFDRTPSSSMASKIQKRQVGIISFVSSVFHGQKIFILSKAIESPDFL